MNTENDVKEFGFRHILINTVYNARRIIDLSRAIDTLVSCYFF